MARFAIGCYDAWPRRLRPNWPALAPRSTLVRIATGRDAADTAFLNVLSGRAELVSVSVTAVADELPNDDLDQLVSVL